MRAPEKPLAAPYVAPFIGGTGQPARPNEQTPSVMGEAIMGRFHLRDEEPVEPEPEGSP